MPSPANEEKVKRPIRRIEISPNLAYWAVSLHPSVKQMLVPRDCMTSSARTKTDADELSARNIVPYFRSRFSIVPITPLKLDASVRSRHTRESGYPGVKYILEKTGFPFARE
jgi:hypothetical protein